MPIRLFLKIFVLIFCISANIYAQALESVSLHDKIGQMLILGFDGTKVNQNSVIVKDIMDDNLGGVILFDYNYKDKAYGKNIKNINQVKKLIQDLHSFNQQGNLKHHRPRLPLFISVDYEGGRVNRLKPEYGYPAVISQLKAAQSKNITQKNANIMATTLEDSGFNLVFSPVLDVDINPDNPVIGKLERSFSKNPEEVTQYGKIYSQEFSNKHIECVYKHFPGHGSSTKDSHLGFVDVSTTWREKELIPYKKLINQSDSCNFIMTAHIINKNLDSSGLPATLSSKVLTELLRKKLNFQGVIITDDLQMNAIADNFGLEEAIITAINAGADILLFGNQLTDKDISAGEIIKIVEHAVKTKKISESRISEAYTRIVKLKKNI